MRKEEYLERYQESSEEIDCEGGPDFCTLCLKGYMEEEPLLLPALDRFHMKPEDLLEIINALGGAELYGFKDLTVLKGMILLYKHTENTERVCETDINLDIFHGILYELKLGEYLPKLIPGRNSNQITLDRALGHIIHAGHVGVLKEYLEHMPSGDDDYFDYYPGVMFYFTTLTEWFLNSENRTK